MGADANWSSLMQNSRARLSPKLPSHLVFLLATSLATFSLSRSALHTSHIVLLFPVCSFALVAFGLLVKKVSETVRRREALTPEVLEGWRGSRPEWFTAVVWSVGEGARMLVARQAHVTVWVALQLYLLPILAFLGFFGHDSKRGPSILGGTALVVAVSLQLWSVQISATAIALSIAQIAAEGWKWTRLTKMKEDEESEASLMRTSAYAAATSFLVFLAATIFQIPSESDTIGYRPQSVVHWALLLILSSSIALYALFDHVNTFADQPAEVVTQLAASPALVLGAGMLIGQDGADTRVLRYCLMATYIFRIAGVWLWRSRSQSGQDIVLAELDEEDDEFSQDSPSPSSSSLQPLFLFALLPLLFYCTSLLLPFCPLPFGYCQPRALPRPTLDVVIAHYDRPLHEVRTHINRFLDLPFAQQRDVRVFVYEKGATASEELWRSLPLKEERGDQVVRLENWGREGGTYLRHILAQYSSENGTSSLADHTLFLQSHLAWPWLALHRLTSLHDRTGFLSFGPYVVSECGDDGRTGGYEGVRRIWEMVRGSKCKGVQTVTWSGQFAVSKGRILAHPREMYQKLDDMLEAPDDDPIHREWGPNGSSSQSNPTFGHALERSWPAIFDCSRAELAERCREGVWKIDDCQCKD